MCWRDQSGRGRHFVPVATAETVDELGMLTLDLDPKRQGRLNVSIWVLAATCILFVSNIMYMVAFLTTGWGRVDVVTLDNKSDHWDFGLWQTCRYSDGLCIGPRWPDYYSVTRAFGVIGLFGHVLGIAWLIGYALEKLLDYDECALGSLTTLSFFTAICILVQVSTFGTMWENDMETEFKDVTRRIDASLSYSFAMTCVTPFFLVIVGLLEIIEIRSSLLRLAAKLESNREFVKVEAPEVLRLSKRRKEKVQLFPEEIYSNPEAVLPDPVDNTRVLVVGSRFEEIEMDSIS